MKKGETVVKIMKVGGVECAVIGKIREVKNGKDRHRGYRIAYFGNDESLAYDASTGREIDPAPGFAAAGISSRLVRLDGAK